MTLSPAQLLAKYGIRPQRRFGQNFLVNQGVLDKIAAAVECGAHDHVIEIGPGIGTLTRRLLAQGAHVTAVDADPAMVALVRAELGASSHLTVIQQDILAFTPPTIAGTYRVAGNIPYNISSPILIWLCEHAPQIHSAVLTMQREVAQRLSAQVGTKAYSALTIAVQSYARVERLFDIRPNSFRPAPRVTSTTVRLTFPDPPPHHIPDRRIFRDVVRAAFGQRRKMLRNTIPVAILEAAGIDPTRRPETLTIAEFIAIAKQTPIAIR